MYVIVLHPAESRQAVAWVTALRARGHMVDDVVSPNLTEIGAGLQPGGTPDRARSSSGDRDGLLRTQPISSSGGTMPRAFAQAISSASVATPALQRALPRCRPT